MRVKPLVGDVAWFGPRRFGWGWEPITWHGWAVTVGLLVVTVLGGLSARPGGLALSIGSIVALLVATVVKGTSPGGPAAARAFRNPPVGDTDGSLRPNSLLNRVLLTVGSAALGSVLGLLLLVTVAPAAIAPPSSATVGAGRLEVDLRGPYHLLALRSGVTVPLASITSARFEPDARGLPRGSRVGTYIPGGLIAGTFGKGASKALWALQHDGALVIELAPGQPFSTLVLEVRNPTKTLDALSRAGVRTR